MMFLRDEHEDSGNGFSGVRGRGKGLGEFADDGLGG